MINITPAEFNELVKFVESQFGIDLSKKKHLIEGRLAATLAEKNIDTFTDYITILKKKNSDDLDQLLNKLTTNYTYFMREKEHFDFFKNTILPHLEKSKGGNRVLSIWSAGCSSGEEPYTLSMIMDEYFKDKPGKWDTRVLATDISQRVLSLAKAAVYSQESINQIPQTWKTKYFKNNPDGTVSVTKSIKDNVIFKTFNLMDPIQFKMKFDVIFCRNVMIYFDADIKDALVERYYNATNDGGYLLIGHSETLNKVKTRYNYLMPATYKK